MSPSDYLFNDLACAHTRLVVDLAVFNIWAEWQARENEMAEKKRKLQYASAK